MADPDTKAAGEFSSCISCCTGTLSHATLQTVGVDSSDMQPCTAVKRNGPCCFVKVFIIRFVAVHYSVPRRGGLFSVVISAWSAVPITHAQHSLFAIAQVAGSLLTYSYMSCWLYQSPSDYNSGCDCSDFCLSHACCSKGCAPQGMEASALNRWGHSATLYGDKLVVFGG